MSRYEASIGRHEALTAAAVLVGMAAMYAVRALIGGVSSAVTELSGALDADYGRHEGGDGAMDAVTSTRRRVLWRR